MNDSWKLSINDAMPVSFRSESFTSYILTIFSETYAVNMRNCQLESLMPVKIIQKKCIC